MTDAQVGIVVSRGTIERQVLKTKNIEKFKDVENFKIESKPKKLADSLITFRNKLTGGQALDKIPEPDEIKAGLSKFNKKKD